MQPGQASSWCARWARTHPALAVVCVLVLVPQVVRREGMSRGFGFVTFKDEISVEKCLLVNHYIKGRKVELKRAVPKVREAGRRGEAG